jgi:radical SAM superfamily enzyme YgiQ (UPF0313 family)
MKICLLTCAAPFLIDERVFPPLGLLAVGTALENDGNEVSIVDTPNDSHYFGLGPTTPEYTSALNHLHTIKEQDATAVVVIGGPHAIANPQECLADGFDVVILGDGEGTKGTTFSQRGIVDLGQVPMEKHALTNRSLIDVKSYKYQIRGKQATTLMTTRGCPYHCGFCAKTETKTRHYPLEHVKSEIAYLHETFGYESLMFFDDTFITKRDKALQICDELQSRGIAWRCFVRGDIVVKHGLAFLKKMKASGCVEVGIGIESGSEKILQSIRKGESVETIRHSLFLLQQAKIASKGFFIIGLPGESPKTLEQTRTFLRTTPVNSMDFTVYQPYKGSPIWDQQDSYDITFTEPKASERFYKGRSGEYRCAVSTSSLSSEEIQQARDSLEKEFSCQQ